MPAETTLGISYETRDDLETIQRALRCANGGRAVSWDETVRELMAAWHELRNMVRDDADTYETTLGISYETRDDLETIQRALRCANGGRAVSTVRELMAAWHELRNMVRDDADT